MLHTISKRYSSLALTAADWLTTQPQPNLSKTTALIESVATLKIHLLLSNDALRHEALDKVRAVVAECIKDDCLSHDAARVIQLTVWRAGEAAYEEQKFV